MDNEHLEQLEKAKTAINIIDKILPHLPDQGGFHFAYFAKDVLKWPAEEVRELVYVKPQLVHIALNHLQYIDEKTKDFYYELNKTGREAKKAGGHFAYLKVLDDKKNLELKRQERKDTSDKYDLLNKKWQYRTKLLPYLVSFIALTFSILSYFRPEKKQADLQQVQQNLQQLQERVKSFDTLFQADTHLKKHNE